MRTDVAIIGAGPAGMAAAETVARSGLDVVVIDEQARAGGQILRQPPASFRVGNWLTDQIYRPQQALLQRCASAQQVRWLHSTTVLGIDLFDTPTLCLDGPDGTRQLVAERVLIATGCHDMPVSFPGSTLPGVMATGGIQAFVKSQQIVPGDRFVFSGSHPLQLIVADQVARAGGEVAAVLFAQPASVVLQALRRSGPMLRQPAKLQYLLGALYRLWRRGVPVRFGQTVARAHGTERLETIDIVDSGTLQARQTIDCDRLGIGFSFLASSQLAGQAGLELYWSASEGGWLARADEWMRSSQPGIYIAGEVTGVAGADVSQREGELAGLGIAMDSGSMTAAEADIRARPLRRELGSLYRFAKVLSTLSFPGEELLGALMTSDSILCKCEEVTVGEARAVLEEPQLSGDLSAHKLLSRCGMGLCQGRYCQYQLRLLYGQHQGATHAGGFQARFPVKPVSIGSLASLRDPEGN